MHACTIIARNYLPFARVLAASFREHHPDSRFSTLVIDDVNHEVDQRDEPFEVLRLEDIGLDPLERRRMTLLYDVMELATAVKPWLLRTLLESSETAMYLDPDIEVFASLDHLGDLAHEHDIALTPHALKPMPRDGRRPTEGDILQSGVYNLGFIAVGRQAGPFLDWWAERLLRDAISDPERMLFTDQRWVDFAPSYFRHVIVRDPGCNVAYWNADGRTVSEDGGTLRVDDVPLRFFHFSGYDPERPYLLSKHQGERPRVLLSEHPGIAELCRLYGDKLWKAGYGDPRPPYAYSHLAGGITVDRRMRRLYRSALVEFEREGGEPPVEPGEDQSGSEAFLRWLNEPVAPLAKPVISRYLHELYSERPDLQAAFPDLGGAGGAAFLEWARRHGRVEVPIADALLGVPPPNSSATLAPTAIGFNVAGYFRAELGVGEAARMLLAAIDSAGISHSTLTYGKTLSRQEHTFDEHRVGALAHNVNLVCVNADQTESFAHSVGPAFYASRATVGVWAWEVTDFPASMLPAFEHVDEVWVGSHHTWKAVAPVSPKPVFVLPLPVVPPPVDPTLRRGDLGLPDRFMFLFLFDFLSVSERKNPVGLIEAFAKAFRPGEGPVLVIKTMNGDKRLNDLERVRAAAARHADIILLDRYLSAPQKNALINLCDCYVSLHRSEGFGFTMAEAMALGKPVIATGYSGNLEFMDHANSYLVPWSLVPVGPGADPYPPESLWAEPDLDAAAALMRGVFRQPEAAAAVGRRARADMAEKHSPAARAPFLLERLDALQSRRRRSGSVRPAGSRAAQHVRSSLRRRAMQYRDAQQARTDAIVRTAADLEERLRREMDSYRRQPPGGEREGS